MTPRLLALAAEAITDQVSQGKSHFPSFFQRPDQW